jgi:hypothetical protein
MNRLVTFGSLGIAGLFGTGLLASQLPALADAGADDAPAAAGIVRVDDHGRDHAERGRHRAPHPADDPALRELIEEWTTTAGATAATLAGTERMTRPGTT